MAPTGVFPSVVCELSLVVIVAVAADKGTILTLLVPMFIKFLHSLVKS